MRFSNHYLYERTPVHAGVENKVTEEAPKIEGEEVETEACHTENGVK